MQAPIQAGRDNPRDAIDISMMTSAHAWNSQPVTNMNFRNLVEESTSARADMLQYRSIAQVDTQGAKDTFSLIGNGSCLFTVPETLQCDRTFALGSYDAYYLDAMDQYLHLESDEFKIEDIPLVQRSLSSQSFSGFNRRVEFFKEHIERRRIQRWVPSQAHEKRHFSDMQLAENFSKVEAWINDVFQPAALPIPSPFVAYYYHLELRKCQGRSWNQLNQREKRLVFCLENEYYVLFVAFWWKEAYFGGRQFLLDTHTINVLHEKCQSLNSILNKPVQVIVEHMRSALAKSEEYHNWMVFDGNEMEDSTFVWARNGDEESMPGEFDPYEPCGITVYCNIRNRRITRKRYSSATFRRGKSLLQKTILVPDLERVPGLVSIIRKHGWDRRGNIKLSHLLENFVNLQNCFNGMLDQFKGVGDSIPFAANRYVQHVGLEGQSFLSDGRAESPERDSGRAIVPHRNGHSAHERGNRYNEDIRGYDYKERSHHRNREGHVQYDPYDERERSCQYDYYGQLINSDRQHGRYDSGCGRTGGTEHRYGGDTRRTDAYQGHDDTGRNAYRSGDQLRSRERYYRTHDPVTDVQVDVFTDGNRTPAAEHAAHTNAHEPYNRHYEPNARDREQFDQTAEDPSLGDRRGIATSEAPGDSEPLTQGRYGSGPMTNSLSRNSTPSHGKTMRSDPSANVNIRSDVKISVAVPYNTTPPLLSRNQSHARPIQTLRELNSVPTGNFAWLLKDSLKHGSETPIRSEETPSDDSLKGAMTENGNVVDAVQKDGLHAVDGHEPQQNK